MLFWDKIRGWLGKQAGVDNKAGLADTPTFDLRQLEREIAVWQGLTTCPTIGW